MLKRFHFSNNNANLTEWTSTVSDASALMAILLSSIKVLLLLLFVRQTKKISFIPTRRTTLPRK